MKSLQNKTDLISVIVPVHNTVAYLRDCICSIVNQTYENIEIICVDDHSDEETAEALDKESQMDERIQVMHLDEAVGAGEARNIGMKKAKGSYLMFLDSDDVFEFDLIESLYNDISFFDADICVCGFKSFDSKTGRKVIDFYPKSVEGVTDGCFKLSQLDEAGLTLSNMGPWNKIYRKDFLDRHRLEFQTLSSSNDLSFVVLCFLYADKVVYCKNKKPLCNYRVNNSVQISGKRKSINLYWAFERVVDELGKSIDSRELTQVVYAYMFLALSELNSCKDEEVNREFYDRTKGFLEKVQDSVSIRDYVINKRIKWFLTMDYDTRWFNVATDFDGQIRDHFDDLSREVSGNERILIWGNGAKSKALQRVLKCKKYENVIVADIKNDQVGEITESGYRIIHTDEVNDDIMKIIATNQGIFNSLSDKGLNCINLEKYCEYE